MPPNNNEITRQEVWTAMQRDSAKDLVKGTAMLLLNLKDGEYLTIGEDIVIQVFTTSTIKISVQAPKNINILRGEVLERNGEKRPDCLYDHPSAKIKKARKNLTLSNG